jgi:uncharacterized repeat protein (TIGR03806 family)
MKAQRMRWVLGWALCALMMSGCDQDAGGQASSADAADLAAEDADSLDSSQPDSGDASDASPERVPFGLTERPENLTCVAPARPPQVSALAAEVAWPQLTFSQPVYLTQPPGDEDAWYLIERAGRVLRLSGAPQTATKEVFADVRGQVESGPGEAGLLGLAFHPQWPGRAEVFLSYTAGAPLRSRVSRFGVTGGALDPGSEEVLLEVEQPYGNHNGGQLEFGPDGYLYLSLGDGGSGGDPDKNGQNTQTLLGALLRLDIDTPGQGQPYGIPADNPFAADPDRGRPELFAWGLRNVWRFSFDRDTGALWAGDVGQGEWEEVDIIQRGGNYGWNTREGMHCYAAQTCARDGLIDPVAEHAHSAGEKSITGGYVYHGQALAGLGGTYIYGDFVSGRVFGLGRDPATGAYAPALLLESGLQIASFAQGRDGELYILDYEQGQIHRLTPAQPAGPDLFPKKLSETGCVQPDAPAEPAQGAIPYAVNAPLWSDGAQKARWFALPQGATIDIDEASGDWTLPVGSVVVKRFSLGGAPVETRLLVRHADGGWAGYSYAWDDDGQDATLLAGGLTRTFQGQTWTYPSRNDCMACHTTAAGFTLGLETAQLNGDALYPGNRVAHQLVTLDHIGALSAPLGDPSALPAFPDLNDLSNPGSGAIGARARAYLHSNCSGCHRPGGPTNAAHDLRAVAPLQPLCDATPTQGDLGLSSPRLITAGDPARSMISHRMERLDAYRMPPLGSARVDDAGLSLIDAWIETLRDCQP